MVPEEQLMEERTEIESLATELHDTRDDPDEWGEEAVEIAVALRRTEVVSFRLPSAELDELEAAASEAGESISEFVRGALALRMHGRISEPLFDLWATPATLVVHQVFSAQNRTGVAVQLVPDFPPLLANVTGESQHP